MRTIWKFPLQMIDEQVIELPANSRVLSAGLDPAGLLCVWAQVDSEQPKSRAAIFIQGTGQPLIDGIDYWPHENNKFIGSVLQGQFVWHVFARYR